MNTREYYAQAFKAERPKFVRVLQAVRQLRDDLLLVFFLHLVISFGND